MKINNKLINIIDKAEAKNRKTDFLKDDFTLKSELSIVKGFNIEPRDYSKCKILFLGTIPSKSSKENGFYYFNSNNAFYEFIYNALSTQKPKLKLNNNCKNFNKLKIDKDNVINDLKKYKIALYDIISACIRFSSSDDDIVAYKLRTKSNIINILRNSHISTIFCTSKISEKYLKECLKDAYTQINNGGKIMINTRIVNVVVLHSSSPRSFYGKWTKDKVKKVGKMK